MQPMVWDIVRALAILVIAFLAGSWAKRPLGRVVIGRVEPTTAAFLIGAVRPLALIVALPPALELLGVSMNSALAVLSTAGLAIALALRDALSNVASGAILLTMRPFLVGDRVTIAAHNGVVIRIGFLMVEIQTDDGRRVTLMNDKVLAAPMERHAADGFVRLELTVRLPRLASNIAQLEAAVTPLGFEVVVQEIEADRVRVTVWTMVHPTDLKERQHALRKAVEASVLAPPAESPEPS